jgi:hypothetical protein
MLHNRGFRYLTFAWGHGSVRACLCACVQARVCKRVCVGNQVGLSYQFGVSGRRLQLNPLLFDQSRDRRRLHKRNALGMDVDLKPIQPSRAREKLRPARLKQETRVTCTQPLHPGTVHFHLHISSKKPPKRQPKHCTYFTFDSLDRRQLLPTLLPVDVYRDRRRTFQSTFK